MSDNTEKIVVFCSHSVTGGPEVLHQLVDALRALGHAAYICYYPFAQKYKCPSPYQHYDAPQISFSVDNLRTRYIVPETATWILRRYSLRRVSVWWLSVDNYFGYKRQSIILDQWVRGKSLIRHRVPIWLMRGYEHYVQSEYAKVFLAGQGIVAKYLPDYLSDCHRVIRGDVLEKRNIVIYNPKKGLSRIAKLIARYPTIKFVPIQNMTPHEVARLFETAKIYLDLGHHPGQDRPPREAAMARCCVITNTRGAAAFFADVPIPSCYKLDDKTDRFIEDFGNLSSAIFSDYAKHEKHFEEYKRSIYQGKEIFFDRVRAIFGEKRE